MPPFGLGVEAGTVRPPYRFATGWKRLCTRELSLSISLHLGVRLDCRLALALALADAGRIELGALLPRL